MTLILSGTNGVSDIDGDASTPAIRGTDANTGIFFGTDVIGFSEGGTEAMRINADAQIVAAAGTVSLPVVTTTGDLNTGIYFPAADTIGFVEGGAEAMRIDSSGNVGIGTSSPVQLLTVESSSNVRQVIRNSTESTSYASSLDFVTGTGSLSSSNLVGRVVGVITQANPSSLQSALTFHTNGGDSVAERIRIDASGNFMVGITSAAGKFTVAQATASLWTEYCYNTTTSGQGLGHISAFTARAPNDYTSLFYYGSDNVAARFVAYSNGGIANYQANNINLSDRREKTNFAPAKNYLETICSIPVQTFTYIDQAEDDPDLTLGVVAQDVQAVAPELVKESDWSAEKDGSKMRLSIYQTDLQYALMKSIQELKAELDTVKAELATLKGN